MAFVLTYDNIVQDLQTYCQRSDTDFINSIPGFVTYALNRISKDLEILGAVQVISGTMIPDAPTIQKPSLWMNNVNFSIGIGENSDEEFFLKMRKYETAIQYQESSTEAGDPTGQPLFYADYDAYHWLITPVPDQAYPFQISYFRRFEPLDIQNQTNWLTENDPESLWLACWMKACLFTDNMDKYNNLQPVYVEAISSLIGRDKSRQTDRFSKGDKV